MSLGEPNGSLLLCPVASLINTNLVDLYELPTTYTSVCSEPGKSTGEVYRTFNIIRCLNHRNKQHKERKSVALLTTT